MFCNQHITDPISLFYQLNQLIIVLVNRLYLHLCAENLSKKVIHILFDFTKIEAAA